MSPKVLFFLKNGYETNSETDTVLYFDNTGYFLLCQYVNFNSLYLLLFLLNF